jgi:hypothetical protein
MKTRLSAIALVITWAAFAVAQKPFDGTWALNQQKSSLTGDTITFSPAGSGALKFSNAEETYQFKTDGSQTNTPNGNTVTWKESSPNSFEHTMAVNGTTISTSTWKVSDDGKTLNVDSHGTRPNSETWQNSETYERVGGGNGLAGKWKSTKVNLGSPNTLTFSQAGPDSLKIEISAEKATWEGKMDGQDHPASGPTVPKGLTLAVSPTSASSFKLVEKINGKTLDIANYSVSGNTLTVKGTNGEGKEPYTEVWERKS